MTLVIDASVALKWFLQEADSEAAAALLDGSELLIAPDLVVAEVCNAGWKAVRIGAAVPAQIEIAASRLPLVFDELVPLPTLAADAVALAMALGHPVYDCFYLALAAQRGTRLVTADRQLRSRAAGTEWADIAVPLSGPA